MQALTPLFLFLALGRAARLVPRLAPRPPPAASPSVTRSSCCLSGLRRAGRPEPFRECAHVPDVFLTSRPDLMQRSFSDASVLSSVATMPRTSEVLWDGASSLPFVLKRKRNGAILVTKIKADRSRGDTTLDLRLGSELKLVGGFPVQQLTLGEVKKVMLHAPKPVSLVFLNHDDVVLDNMSFLSEYRGSFENEFEYDSSDNNSAAMYPTLRESSEWQETSKSEFFNSAYESYNPFDSSRSLGSSVFDTPTPASVSHSTSASASALTSTSRSSSSASRRRRRSPDANSQQRKVSKLKQAFDRMNELLNRPVRRSGLNLTSGKSIVV